MSVDWKRYCECPEDAKRGERCTAEMIRCNSRFSDWKARAISAEEILRDLNRLQTNLSLPDDYAQALDYILNHRIPQILEEAK